MQEHFSYKPGAYYSHVLFFLSTALHRVMPEYMQRAIMIDADLKFMGDIAQLYHHFDAFSAENIIGIAHDAQPVYRHLFWQYRQEHPGTLVGEPPPLGHPGFNSGVLLLELSRMRNSTLYNSLLDSAAITQLCDEFHFKGHLGDQDFFTLVSMRYKHLFYVLPCWWNRQLCQWWRDHGYSEVFELYFHCDGDVMIYHGNCNTAIP
jgi:lipopolysaccharide biosynthesis glycosyltransferase